MSDDWKRDWSRFISVIEELIAAGVSNDELNERFSGQVVRWRGVVEKVDLNEAAPGVDIAMPARVVDLGGGKTWTVDGLHLPVSRDAIAAWRNVEVGDELEFEASLGTAKAVFAAVEVIEFSTGKKVLRTRVHGGRIVGRSA